MVKNYVLYSLALNVEKIAYKFVRILIILLRDCVTRASYSLIEAVQFEGESFVQRSTMCAKRHLLVSLIFIIMIFLFRICVSRLFHAVVSILCRDGQMSKYKYGSQSFNKRIWVESSLREKVLDFGWKSCCAGVCTEMSALLQRKSSIIGKKLIHRI